MARFVAVAATLLAWAGQALSSICGPIKAQSSCAGFTEMGGSLMLQGDPDMWAGDCIDFCQNIGVTLQTESDETSCCMLNTVRGSCYSFTGEGITILGPPMYTYTTRSSALCSPRVGQHRPHILLVVLDDAGFNDFQFGMANRISTPAMTALAADGVLLNSHYTMPICGPSRSALHTGRHPLRIGRATFNVNPHEFAYPRSGFDPNDRQLAEAFHEAGYSTYGFGKWHMGHESTAATPTQNGYDLWVGKLVGSGDHWTHLKSSEGPSCNSGPMLGIDMRHCVGDSLTTLYNKSGIFSTELFTEAAIEAIEAHPSDKSAFIYIAYTAPHTPVQAPAEFIARTDAVYEDLPNRRTIAAMMADVDHAIGRVQASLEQRDMWKDTVTVILSDNGGTAGRETDPGVYSPPLDEMVHSNYPLRGFKGAYLEGGIRTAALVHTSQAATAYPRAWSGVRSSKAGTVLEGIAFVSDWMPTLLDVAGAPVEFSDPDPDVDGVSLWRSFSEENEPHARTELLNTLSYNCNSAERGRCGAFRMGDWKYIQLKRRKRKEGWSAPDLNPAVNHIGELEIPNANPVVSLNISCTPQNLVRPEDECIDAPCLFNVRDDPCENVDHREGEPEIFERLRTRFHEIADKYVRVRLMGQRSSPGCVAVAKGAWGLWQDKNSGSCESLSGRDRFDLATNLRPSVDADELSPGNSEHQCALQCLAAEGCLGFFFVLNLNIAGTNQGQSERPMSPGWDWSGAPVGVCHLYRRMITVDDMLPTWAGGYYSLLGCDTECTTNALDQFSQMELKRPKHASNTLESISGLTEAQCGDLCLSTFGCKSFTHLDRGLLLARCHLYEKNYKARFLVDHDSKVYHSKHGECLEPCPVNIANRFTLVPNSRPKHAAVFTIDYNATSVTDCTAACLAAGSTMCSSFTFAAEMGNQCRFFARRSYPKFLKPHANKDYFVLKASTCIPVGNWADVLGQDDDGYVEHRAGEADDDYNDDEPYSRFFGRAATPTRYDFRLRGTTGSGGLASAKGPLVDEDENREPDYTVPIVCAVVSVAVLTLTVTALFGYAKKHNDAASQVMSQDFTLSGSSRHSETNLAASVSVDWDQQARVGVAVGAAELGCDTELVQPQCTVSAVTASSELARDNTSSTV